MKMPSKLKVFASLIILIGVFGLGAYAGIQWQQYRQINKCLDVGGGINPGGGELCILEVPRGAGN